MVHRHLEDVLWGMFDHKYMNGFWSAYGYYALYATADVEFTLIGFSLR